MRKDLAVGIAAVVLFVVLGAVAIVSLVVRTRSHDDAHGSGAPILSALVAADGRHITVAGTAPTCSDAQLRAHEHNDSVELELTTTPSHGPCALIAGPSVRIVARTVLAHPLSSRRLVDSMSSAAVPYFDGRDLRRTAYLPAGWKLQTDYPGPDSDLSAQGKPSWGRIYSDASGQLTITQSYGVITDRTPGPVVTTVQVQGVAVAVHASDHAYSALWTDGQMHFSVDVPPTGRGDLAMSRTQLVRVLEGLQD